MAEIGIVQRGADVLTEVARPFDLSTDAGTKVLLWEIAVMWRQLQLVKGKHTFTKGVGVAANQITKLAERDIPLAAAIVEPPGGGGQIVLVNPRIVGEHPAFAIDPSRDVRDEGCLSDFDYRYPVARTRELRVQHLDIGQLDLSYLAELNLDLLEPDDVDLDRIDLKRLGLNTAAETVSDFCDGTARLVAHEVDHLLGISIWQHAAGKPRHVSVASEAGKPWEYE